MPNSGQLSRVCLIAGAVLGIFMFSGEGRATIKSDQHLDFRVFLEDREIGYHRVALRSSPQVTDVSIEASFDVKVLFFTAFSYRHRAKERWNGPCLETIDTETDIGGKSLYLRSETTDKGLIITNPDKQTLLTGCVRSYAYWDLDRLRASRLLNTQTGEYQNVEITDIGVKPLQVARLSMLAQCYKLTTEEGDIFLWYSPENEWQGLQTQVKGDRVLSYFRNTGDKHE